MRQRSLLLPLFVVTHLLFATVASVLADPAQKAPNPPRYSQRYTIKLNGQPKPILLNYEKVAKKLDRDHNRVLTASELGVTAKDLPGHLRVDIDDYVLGLAQEYTGSLSSYLSGYPSTAEIEGMLQAIQAAHPDRVTLVPLGTTAEGHTLMALRVGLNDGRERPKLAVVAQQHAREWIAHQAALATVRALVEEPANADLLQIFEFWVVALANPDGYEYSRTTDPMWRKNRRKSGTADESDGVDLNRNFATDFRRDDDSPQSTDDDWGASDRPYSNQYRGPSAASEPETQDLQDMLKRPGMAGVVDLHGFGCKIVLPDQPTHVPDAMYQSLAESMLSVLGDDYEIMRYRDLYPVTGHLAGFADAIGVPGITLEMGKAFQPNPNKIAAVSQEGSRGVFAFARALAATL